MNLTHLCATAVHQRSQELIVEAIAAPAFKCRHHSAVHIDTIAVRSSAKNSLEIHLVAMCHVAQDFIGNFGYFDEVFDLIWLVTDAYGAGTVRSVADSFAIRVVFADFVGKRSEAFFQTYIGGKYLGHIICCSD
jgi:hypothetical protein